MTSAARHVSESQTEAAPTGESSLVIEPPVSGWGVPFHDIWGTRESVSGGGGRERGLSALSRLLNSLPSVFAICEWIQHGS